MVERGETRVGPEPFQLPRQVAALLRFAVIAASISA